MARIELTGVDKSFDGVAAVKELNLTIEDGSFTAILGPSGCGKTTTLLMLAGIYIPTRGEIRFDGQVVNEVEARDRNVGVVFQSYALYPHMTVRDNILFPLRMKRVGAEQARERAEQAARMVHVESLLERKPGQLSGGQQQRVALARALVKEPQLLLLDEPLSNLDAALRLTLRGEIKALQRSLAITTILVTHDQIEAMTVADRIVCMSDGRVQQSGTHEDLYRRPANRFVAGFIGAPSINFVEGFVAGGRFRNGNVELPCPDVPEGGYVLGLRPEFIRFAAAGLPASIVEVESMGRETLYLAESPLGTLSVIEPGMHPRHRPGDAVALTFDGPDTLLFDKTGSLRVDGGHVWPRWEADQRDQ